MMQHSRNVILIAIQVRCLQQDIPHSCMQSLKVGNPSLTMSPCNLHVIIHVQQSFSHHVVPSNAGQMMFGLTSQLACCHIEGLGCQLDSHKIAGLAADVAPRCCGNLQKATTTHCPPHSQLGELGFRVLLCSRVMTKHAWARTTGPRYLGPAKMDAPAL
jgi:hypothetical protein